ncbi:hypothetical protein GOBAR_AA12334 [Gossypium barbadense]|uniref:Uncharacterized protein n=1 Tax=Gossypium barbadense TaxID=3634 RepID=A0A2P5XY77_GOSBA|nr:hypothetical protein GOBAR_AA12334 [Gossypium barbadense]
MIEGMAIDNKRLNLKDCNLCEQPVMKDHIFIRYFSRDVLYPISLKDKCGEHDEAKTTDCLDQECDQLELSFPSYDQDPKYKKISNFCDPLLRLNIPGSVKVNKCGVGLMSERDLEEMEQVQKLHSS